MSLRNYLFALVGILIITLTLSQLFLINWINNQLHTEVEQQAEKLSQKILELAVEEITIVPEKTPVIIRTKDSDFDEQEIQTNIEIISSDGNKTIKRKIARAVEDEHRHSERENIDSEMLKKELHDIVQKLHVERRNLLDAQATIIVKETSSPITQNINKSKVWVQSPEQQANKARNKLVNLVQWSIIGSALLALTVAFWLSTKFNKPLKQLSQGFDKLAKGDYNHHVEASGVNEIRQTIKHFNDMVKRLHKLTEQESHHKELTHLAELGEVSRGLAHTLRNPIHTIGLSIEQLQDSELSQEKKQALITTIKSKIIHIDRHIKALLTLTTSSIKRDTPVPINAVVQDIILEHKFGASNNLSFTTDIENNLTVKGSESEIRSILHTLITNACEANLNQGGVSITAKQREQQICIEVKDQGNGLKEEISEKLFQPHISTKPEGAGMGLYIAKRLLSLHYNGSISLKNIITGSEVSGCSAKITLKDADE